MARRKSYGLFLTFEGAEAVGKSTQIRLLAAALKKRGYRVTCTREPGGTPLGDELRALVKSKPMHARTELLVFEASRSELVETLIRPRLEKGEVVICDRFEESSLIYQGLGRGLGIKLVASANALATGGLRSQLVIVLDPQNERTIHERLKTRRRLDRIEKERREFHRKVIQGFRNLAKRDRRVRLFPAEMPLQELHGRILTLVLKRLERA